MEESIMLSPEDEMVLDRLANDEVYMRVLKKLLSGFRQSILFKLSDVNSTREDDLLYKGNLQTLTNIELNLTSRLEGKDD